MVSLSSRSPIRESPRLLGAGLLVAVCLVAIGLGIGWATASPSQPAPQSGASIAQLRRTVASQRATLRSQQASITSLKADLTGVRQYSAATAAALRRSRRLARCWRARAQHPHKAKSATCAAGS